MPRVSREMVEKRPGEIIDACRRLYRTMAFKEITLKEISKETSLSRPSIYNYFQTKEEIFLALLEEEYRLWADDLEQILSHDGYDIQGFAAAISESIAKRETLLKILCMNLYEIEENSRTERLVEFKKHYGRTIDIIDAALEKFFPDMTTEDRTDFVYEFYPFLYGLYPYVYPTKKQMTAMEMAGIMPRKMEIRKATEIFVIHMLNGIKEGRR